MKTWKWLVIAAIAVQSMGCKPSRTPEQAAGDLAAPSAELRLKAARDIEDGAWRGTLTPAIVDALLQQQGAESDFKARASMLIALGYTGDARVKPILDQYAQTEDPQQRRYAARALKKWASKTGAVPANYEFSADWPYGTQGYPAPLPKK
jgi:hypothetical protein